MPDYQLSSPTLSRFPKARCLRGRKDSAQREVAKVHELKDGIEQGFRTEILSSSGHRR